MLPSAENTTMSIVEEKATSKKIVFNYFTKYIIYYTYNGSGHYTGSGLLFLTIARLSHRLQIDWLMYSYLCRPIRPTGRGLGLLHRLIILFQRITFLESNS